MNYKHNFAWSALAWVAFLVALDMGLLVQSTITDPCEFLVDTIPLLAFWVFVVFVFEFRATVNWYQNALVHVPSGTIFDHKEAL